MAELQGYELGEVIHQRAQTQVRRGARLVDDQSVIIKLLTDEYPPPRALASFELAFKIGRKVACDAVIPHWELLPWGNGLAMVTEDFGAESLDRLDLELDLVGRLRIGAAVARALVEVHARQVINKDIKPHNVVMNPETGVVKLIDFGIASQLTREHPSLKTPGRMEGTLAYVSPEPRRSTGRSPRTAAGTAPASSTSSAGTSPTPPSSARCATSCASC